MTLRDAYAAKAASVSVSLGLCPLRTKRGETCNQKLLEDLPCCFNHFDVWAKSSDANLLRAVKVRTNQVAGVRADGDCVVLSLLKFPRRKAHGWPPYECGYFRLNCEQAQVVADLLSSLGNSDAATRLLQAVAQLG